MAKAIGAAVILVLLVGCGFKPVYQETEGLGGVRVAKIANRSGQILRNNLDMALSVSRRTKPEYLLKVSLAESVRSAGIRLEGDLATRGTYSITARFTLRRMEGSGVIYAGEYKTAGSYDIVGDAFANKAARDHTRLLLVDDVSRNVVHRVAVFLQRRK